jgi:hypothetical protein
VYARQLPPRLSLRLPNVETRGHVYGTITVGPSSVDVASGIGWTATASVGAVAW